MKRAAWVFLCALLAACAAPPATTIGAATAPAAPAAPAVRNAGFEEPTPGDSYCVARWACSAHVDVGSFTFTRAAGGASGTAGLCIERVGKEPWALVTQSFHTTAMRGKTLRLSMAVQAPGLEGGAGPWIQSQGGRAHAAKLVQRTQGWERVSVELAIPAESNLVVIGATLEGPGRACFDDVRLEAL
jgi:hypothetical protein